MRRKFRICFFALLGFMTLFILGLIAGTSMDWKWLPLILGGVSFLFSVFLLIASEKGRNGPAWTWLSVMVSGFGSGMSAAAYYVHIQVFELMEFTEFFRIALILAGAGLGFFILYTLTLNLPFLERHLKWYTFPLLIGGLIALGVFWGWRIGDKVWFSLAFFLFLMTAFFVIPLIIVASDAKELNLHLALVSLGAVLLITIIVLLILSNGEGFDLSIGPDSGSRLRVENPRKSRLNDSEPL